MADNYLERKMEEHREGGRRIVRVVQNAAGTLVVKFPFATAFVYAEAPGECTALLLSRLTSTGCRVGLASADGEAARRVAKARGVMHVPETDEKKARSLFAAIVAEPEVVFHVSEAGISATVGKGTMLSLGTDVEKALLRLLCEL